MVAAARWSLVVVGALALCALVGAVVAEAAVTGAGEECFCTLDAVQDGECLRATSSTTCTTVTCERSYACVPEASSTHVCQARKVNSVLACTGVTRDRQCPCEEVAPPPSQVVLVPVQRTGRSAKCVAGTETHLQVDVEGRSFTCVAPMNIGSQTVKEAYSYKDSAQQGWKTTDDAINMVFLKSRAKGYTAGLYMCVVMGSKAAGPSKLRKITRWAQSDIVLTKGARFEVFDDTTSRDSRDRYRQSLNKRRMVIRQQWQDRFTDGYCFAVAGKVTARFSALRYVSGMSVWRGGTTHPSLGRRAWWSARSSDKARNGPYSKLWAYTSTGLLSHPYTRARKYGSRVVKAPPPPSIDGVTVTPVCGCGTKKAMTY